jgi:hypothetical protein
LDGLASEIIGTYRLFGNEDTSTFTTRQKYKKDGTKNVQIEYDGDRWKIYDHGENPKKLIANQESKSVFSDVCLSDTMHIEWVTQNGKAKHRCKCKQPQIKS